MKKASRLKKFNVNKIMSDILGVHSLTDYTYREQQLVKEAINQCKYKDQLLEWYDDVDINSVKMKSNFGAKSTRRYNDKEVIFVDIKKYFGNGEWYDDVNINSVKMKSNFGAKSTRRYNDKKVIFVNITTYFGN